MRRLVVAVLAGLTFPLVLAGPGRSDPTITDIGWWTRQPLADAPEGGIALGHAPDGPLSVAALRIDVDGDVIVANLTLREAGGQGGDQASIQACAAAAAWEPADGGALEDAPEADCAVAVTLERQDGVWTGNLAPLLTQRGPVSVALVPRPGGSSPLGGTSTYDLTFAPPEFQASSVSTTTTTRPTTTTTSRPTTTTRTATTTSRPATTTATTRSTSGTTATTRTATTAAVATTRATTITPTATTRVGTPPPAAPTSSTGAVSAAAPTSPAAAPVRPGIARAADPDRVRGAQIIPYIVASLLAGAAVAGAKYANDRGLFAFRSRA